jgi:hypothetical protein
MSKFATQEDYLAHRALMEAKVQPDASIEDAAKNITVVYYSSNAEAPEFESKIIADLCRKADHLPLVAVTQKPLEGFTTICVGDVGSTNLNGFRQMLIGAEAAKTRFVLFAEADFLYPKEYFSFVPKKNGMYYYDNVWIVYRLTRYGRGAFKKKMSEGARICDRETFVRVYAKWLRKFPEWTSESLSMRQGDPFLYEHTVGRFYGPPCISFKTGRGLRWTANSMKGPGVQNVLSLPVWGDIPTLRAEMCPDSVGPIDTT